MKQALTLLFLALITFLAPSSPIDPLNLINLKKVFGLIFTLALIQSFGSMMSKTLGTRTGGIMTGFFGGLVSSTATTASLAKKSKMQGRSNVNEEELIFLSATCAMLVEGLLLVLTGLRSFHLSLLILFMGPMLSGTLMIIPMIKSPPQIFSAKDETNRTNFQILPLLKVSVFILLILAFSKFLQIYFGKSSLLVLTFLVSLFELHGSIIANIQLHASETINEALLKNLIGISLVASLVSKVFLVSSLGSAMLRKRVLKITAVLLASVILSWGISLAFN